MLSKKHRVSSRDMLLMRESKKTTYTGTYMRMAVAPSASSYPQVAVVVSKKVAPRAVDRNKLRRRVYGCVQQYIPLLLAGVYVLYLQKNVRDATSQQLCDDVDVLVKKMI